MTSNSYSAIPEQAIIITNSHLRQYYYRSSESEEHLIWITH